MDVWKARRDTRTVVGSAHGWVPVTELDHFMACPACGEMFDMRNLENVSKHWHDGPGGDHGSESTLFKMRRGT